jgi:uncharacterized integral membrane protein
VVVLRFISFVAWTAVFVVVVLFAVKNADPVTLHFYFGAAWETPLVLLLLVSLAAGAVLGVIACLPVLARQRRATVRLRRELELRERGAAAPAGSPAPHRAPARDAALLP